MCGLCSAGAGSQVGSYAMGDPSRYGTLGLVIAICAVPTEVGDRSIATRHVFAAQSAELITVSPAGVLHYLPSWRVRHYSEYSVAGLNRI